jgi:hypothetical protein
MFLPLAKGRFPVGASSFSRFYPRTTIGSINLRPTHPAAPPEPALQLEEIAFTVYYPAEISEQTSGRRKYTQGLDWLIRYIQILGVD